MPAQLPMCCPDLHSLPRHTSRDGNAHVLYDPCPQHRAQLHRCAAQRGSKQPPFAHRVCVHAAHHDRQAAGKHTQARAASSREGERSAHTRTPIISWEITAFGLQQVLHGGWLHRVQHCKLTALAVPVVICILPMGPRGWGWVFF